MPDVQKSDVQSQQNQQAVTSPLTEADSRSLEELFSADPETLTDAEWDIVVEKFRKERQLWSEAERQGKTKGYKAKAADKPKLNLADLLGDETVD